MSKRSPFGDQAYSSLSSEFISRSSFPPPTTSRSSLVMWINPVLCLRVFQALFAIVALALGAHGMPDYPHSVQD